jgi:hypothetical protein
LVSIQARIKTAIKKPRAFSGGASDEANKSNGSYTRAISKAQWGFLVVVVLVVVARIAAKPMLEFLHRVNGVRTKNPVETSKLRRRSARTPHHSP